MKRPPFVKTDCNDDGGGGGGGCGGSIIASSHRIAWHIERVSNFCGIYSYALLFGQS